MHLREPGLYGLCRGVDPTKSNATALKHMVASAKAGVEPSTAEVETELRTLAYRARLLREVEASSVLTVTKHLGPGASRNGVYSYLVGEARASTRLYIETRMKALGWTPDA